MTHSSGTAATSVEMCAVTATSRPDGTAARKTQRTTSRQVGGAASAVPGVEPVTGAAAGALSGDCHNR